MFKSLVLYYSGEGSGGTSTDPPDSDDGSMRTALKLYEQGYDVRFLSPNLFDSSAAIVTGTEYVRDAVTRGVLTLGLVGFSHGGGDVYWLTRKLNAAGLFRKVQLGVVVYMDAIRTDLFLTSSETRAPLGRPRAFANFYQTTPTTPLRLRGDSVPGARPDRQMDKGLKKGKMDHTTIDDSPLTQALIIDQVHNHVGR
jgi:hypothetical protein